MRDPFFYNKLCEIEYTTCLLIQKKARKLSIYQLWTNDALSYLSEPSGLTQFTQYFTERHLNCVAHCVNHFRATNIQPESTLSNKIIFTAPFQVSSIIVEWYKVDLSGQLHHRVRLDRDNSPLIYRSVFRFRLFI